MGKDGAMAETAGKDRVWYLRELNGEACLCGRAKKKMHSFCYRCYTALPPEMRRDLYDLIGAGYEEAFEEAAAWLETEVWA